MPAPKSDEIFVANTSGACEIAGETYTFTKGTTRIRNSGTGAKILKAAPDYFDPVEDRVHYDVEQATAAPGEKRGEAPAKPAEKPSASPTKGLTTESLKG